MALLPNGPNFVNAAPNAATAPRSGFWNERKVAWISIEASLANAFETPWTTTGYTQQVIRVLEERGTVIGVFNDQPPVSNGTGANLYFCLGYAAGEFVEGSQVVATSVAAPTPPTIDSGTDPILIEIANQLLTGYAYPGTTLTISVGAGFTVVPAVPVP